MDCTVENEETMVLSGIYVKLTWKKTNHLLFVLYYAVIMGLHKLS